MFANLKASKVLEELYIDVINVEKEMCDISTPTVYQGTIYDKFTEDKIVEGYVVAKEVDTIAKFQEQIIKNFGNSFVLRPYIDGFVVRVYHYNNHWFMSTNKCLDAYTSNYSSSMTFGEMFEDTLTKLNSKSSVNSTHEFDLLSMPEFEQFTSYTTIVEDLIPQFNQDYIYYFIVEHPEHNSSVENPNMYLLFAKCKTTHQLVNSTDINVPHISKISLPSLNSKVIANEKKGFVLENHNERIVWFKPEFKVVRNATNHKYLGSYLLYLTENPAEMELYIQQNPDHTKYFEQIQDAIVEFCKEAHELYVIRHIQKTFTNTDNKSLHFFVSDKSNDNNLFAIYIRERKRMFLADVIGVFNKYYKRESKFIFLRKYLSTELVGNSE